MRSLAVPGVAKCFEVKAGTSASWAELEAECRREQRQILVDNQSGCCAWCEQEVDLEESHIDHIESRHEKPQRTFDNLNIVASCSPISNDHCGHARTTSSLPGEVDVYAVTNIEQTFRVLADGTLVIQEVNVTTQQHSELERAINDELKLNCKILKAKRERRLSEINDILAGDIPLSELAEIFLDFLSLTDQICEERS